MAGNRNSGRGSWDRERQSKELWDLSIPVLKHALKSKAKVWKMRKVDIALALVNKMLPQDPAIQINHYTQLWTSKLEKVREVDETGRIQNIGVTK
jgi:hypothetical protein